MKFGKRLRHQVDQTLPEWRDKFLCYKDLKKLVRLIASAPSSRCEKAQAEFVYSLNVEMNKLNAFFIEHEEDFIIQHKELEQRIQTLNIKLQDGRQPSETDYIVEMEKIIEDMVNFHGEMVLLENYSNINYTGLAKILKKYDKRTGGQLRLLFIQDVLQQPFFTTNLVSKLIKECENTINVEFPGIKEIEEKRTYSFERKTRPSVVGENTSAVGENILRSTVAALTTIQEMRRGSSTYSQFSLPPLNLPEPELTQYFQLNSPIPNP